MKPSSFPPIRSVLGFAALALLVFPACNTTAPTNSAAAASTSTPQAKRIAEHQADYTPLPATTQQQLAEGIISRGQNLKLVYMALGRPDRIVTTPNTKTITWTYHNYTPPVISTNRTVVGRESRVNLSNNSPLQDTMDAWNNKLLKREVPSTATGEAPGLGQPMIVSKASTQSWAEYGKYREKIRAITDSGRPLNKEERIAIHAISERAELDYKEALTIPPITSPDPVTLDVIFADQRVSDVMINNSFSAFSERAVDLPTAPAPH